MSQALSANSARLQTILWHHYFEVECVRLGQREIRVEARNINARRTHLCLELKPSYLEATIASFLPIEPNGGFGIDNPFFGIRGEYLLRNQLVRVQWRSGQDPLVQLSYFLEGYLRDGALIVRDVNLKGEILEGPAESQFNCTLPEKLEQKRRETVRSVLNKLKRWLWT